MITGAAQMDGAILVVAVDFKVELRIAMGVLVLRSSFFFLKLTPPNSAIT
jgi:hypothetical protein